MTDPQNDKPKTFARKPDARWEDFFRADGVPLSEAPTYTIVPPSAQMIPWPGRNARRHLHFGMEATTVREAELAVSAIVRRWHWIEPSNRFVLAPQAVIDALADFSWEEPQFTESHGWGSVVMRPLAEFALQMIPSDGLTPAGRLVTALAALGVKATIDDDHIATDGEIRGYAAPGGWEIACDNVGDEGDAIEAAANAIAAIVQAPKMEALCLGCFADGLVDEDGCCITCGESVVTGERWSLDLTRETLEDLRSERDTLAAELCDVREVLMGGEPGSLTEAIQGLAVERVALAAEVKRLTERLEVFAGALLSLGAS